MVLVVEIVQGITKTCGECGLAGSGDASDCYEISLRFIEMLVFLCIQSDDHTLMEYEIVISSNRGVQEANVRLSCSSHTDSTNVFKG